MLRYFPLVTILALLFSSCQSSGQKPSTSQEKKVVAQPLRVNIGDEPQSLDPRRARELGSLCVAGMVFEGLTRIGKEEKPELALARRVDVSSDLKTYTFHLRHSSWSNGDPVTAEDFAYAWKKVLDPQFPADNAFQLYVIKNGKGIKKGSLSMSEVGIHVIDPLTLQVELENPTPYFLELVAHPVFFPVNQRVDLEKAQWAENAETFVSNGPFKLVEWKHQNFLRVVKNGSYWDQKSVHLDAIDLMMVKEDTEFKLFEKKQLDWAGSPLSTIPLDAIKDLKQKKVLQTKSALGTYFLRTNVERPPFNNPLLRKAFALAINRQQIVEHVTQGNQIPATGLVPVAMHVQEKPYFQDGNLEEARQLYETALKEIGPEAVANITLTYASSERNHLIAQAVQQQWFEAFGVRVQLEAVEKKVYFSRVSHQDFQLAAGSWFADYNDPINFLEIFKEKKSGSNNTLWEDPEYTTLLDRLSALPQGEERMELLRASEKRLIEAMPIIPIFHYTMLYLKNDGVKDVAFSSMGRVDFKWAQMDVK